VLEMKYDSRPTTVNPYTDPERHNAQRHRQTDDHYDANISDCQYNRPMTGQ